MKLNLEGQTLEKLRKLTGTSCCDFLGFKLNLQNGGITDSLSTNLSKSSIKFLSILFTHYSTATMSSFSGKLVKFKDLPGGCAYEEAFNKRAIQPIADTFGEKPQELLKAGALLGGKPLGFGDASVEIEALKGIPLTYIVYGAEDYPASANIFYDESASRYLPTEDLAVLGEITTIRLISAKTAKHL